MFKKITIFLCIILTIVVCSSSLVQGKRIEDSVSASAPNGNQELLRFAEKAEVKEQAQDGDDDSSDDDNDDDASSDGDDSTENVSKEQAKDAVKAEKINEKLEAANDQVKSTDDAVNAAANEAANEEGEKARKQALEEKKNEEEVNEAVNKAKEDKQNEIEENKKKEKVKKEVMRETIKEAKREAAKEAADAVELSPEEILENEKNRRQEQFLTSLTPEAIASAEVELSSVFSGVLGSLLTNMLSKQPELVERHLAQARKPDPTKVEMVQQGIATAKTSL
jgi:hypothetical protein